MRWLCINKPILLTAVCVFQLKANGVAYCKGVFPFGANSRARCIDVSQGNVCTNLYMERFLYACSCSAGGVADSHVSACRPQCLSTEDSVGFGAVYRKSSSVICTCVYLYVLMYARTHYVNLLKQLLEKRSCASVDNASGPALSTHRHVFTACCYSWFL